MDTNVGDNELSSARPTPQQPSSRIRIWRMGHPAAVPHVRNNKEWVESLLRVIPSFASDIVCAVHTLSPYCATAIDGWADSVVGVTWRKGTMTRVVLLVTVGGSPNTLLTSAIEQWGQRGNR